MSGIRGSNLQPGQVSKLETDLKLVREYMSDGRWATIPDIAAATGIKMDASVSRYLRYLREEKFGGYVVEKRHVASGLWEYRVRVPVAA